MDFIRNNINYLFGILNQAEIPKKKQSTLPFKDTMVEFFKSALSLFQKYNATWVDLFITKVIIDQEIFSPKTAEYYLEIINQFISLLEDPEVLFQLEITRRTNLRLLTFLLLRI